ncbi:class I SAM-dependent methyltransferase [Enterovirga sp. CN4-39]|uniref:class I SAM-dependent methyltransferase n=1 Tax=Enterovirga sp. CN4-39 TaxID=3400910 RepID=UPI003C2B306C
MRDLTKQSFDSIFPGDDFDFVNGVWATQGLLFANDLLQLLQRDLMRQPAGRPMTFLDVGAGPGFGAAFFARLFRGGHIGPKLDVRALELSPQWAEFYPILHDDIPVIVGDLFGLPDSSHDIVVCSHVIEHLEPDEAIRFVRKMVGVSRELTAVICPWKEGEQRHPSHLHSLDEDFVRELHPTEWRVFPSLGWMHPNGCLGMIFRK